MKFCRVLDGWDPIKCVESSRLLRRFEINQCDGECVISYDHVADQSRFLVQLPLLLVFCKGGYESILLATIEQQKSSPKLTGRRNRFGCDMGDDA